MLLLRQTQRPGLVAAGHRRVPGRGSLRAHVAASARPTGRRARVRRLGPAHRSKVLNVRQLFARTGSVLPDERRKREYLCSYRNRL